MEAPQYEIDAQRKMARQRFIDAHRDLPPADKRDTLSLRLSDFIRDLDHYEKDLLKELDLADLADVSAEQMEQLLSCLLYTSYADAKDSERDLLTCDENGFAQTKDLPYGIYTVCLLYTSRCV